MEDCVKRILTSTGLKQIDYRELANLPVIYTQEQTNELLDKKAYKTEIATLVSQNSYNREESITDATKTLFGLDTTAVPNDIFQKLAYSIPIGSIFWLASQTIPEGFLLCDGSNISRTDYAELFAIIGTTFGNEDDITFKIPDLRAKFIRGSGTSNGYSATFGQTQEATAEAVGTNSAPANYDKSESYDTGSYVNGGSSSAIFTKYHYFYRPYNIALTPIIKYRRG